MMSLFWSRKNMRTSMPAPSAIFAITGSPRQTSGHQSSPSTSAFTPCDSTSEATAAMSSAAGSYSS